MKPSLYEVPHVNEFRSLLTHIETTFADHPAFRLKNGDGELYDVSYHTFCHDVNAFGAALRTCCGLQGAHIAIIGENRYHWCVSYLAVTAGTGVAVPLDKELQADDIREILTTAEVQAVITSKKQLSKMRSLSDALCGKKLLICMDEGQDCLSIPELIRQGESLSEQSGLAEPSPAPDDLASILFTSGTTGTQKGVMLTQENICADIRNVRRNVYIGPGDRTLSILPLHHTYECSLGFLCILYSGGTICFCEGLRHLTANLQEYKPTILVAVPLLMENVHKKIMKNIRSSVGSRFKFLMGRGIAELSDAFGVDVRKQLFHEIQNVFGGELRLFIVGAAAIDPKVVKDYIRFGFRVYIGYGLTECAPLVIGNHDGLMTTDTIGVPIEGVEARIDNPDENGVGEIVVKGPNIMKGYYKNEEATRQVFTEDGWLHTGDLGKVDKSGVFRMVGRSKNVIVTKNGKNIYPEELEFHINKSPFVKESLVAEAKGQSGDTAVGVSIFPDMEAIRARFGNLSGEEVRRIIGELIKNVNSKLPKYKSIRHIDIRESDFIKTTTQKIKRFAKENAGGRYVDVDKRKDLDDVIGH